MKNNRLLTNAAQTKPKALPLSDALDYRLLQTETACWRREERRARELRAAFSAASCKQALSIGWRGGVYAQMCGHYLHFDCYHAYKRTLDDSLPRASNVEYACPLCRQLANCVLPVVTATHSLTHSCVSFEFSFYKRLFQIE